MPIIEALGLTKTYRVFLKKPGLGGALRGLFRREYKEVRAVDGVSFTIEPGEMVAFLGPNGAGKTTTLKMLSGLIYPTAGTARGVTMLLTSHYMRDVEALCQRVLVIAHGRVIYDGPLAGITERFGREKQVRLQFLGESVPADLGQQYGEYTASGPVAELKVERARVPEVLGAILERYTVIDMSVQDPPLDQVIAKVFEAGKQMVSV